MEQYSAKKFYLEEFNNLDTKDEVKYELIDGFVLTSPRPNYKHQEIMGKLNLEVSSYLKGKDCNLNLKKGHTSSMHDFQLYILHPLKLLQWYTACDKAHCAC